jgi:hypothetical protein
MVQEYESLLVWEWVRRRRRKEEEEGGWEGGRAEEELASHYIRCKLRDET